MFALDQQEKMKREKSKKREKYEESRGMPLIFLVTRPTEDQNLVFLP